MRRGNNGTTIRRLAARIFKANKMRNTMAIMAIVLMSLLFSALFSILTSTNATVEQESFRQVGGDFHGGLKYITKEEVEELEKDEAITESGRRWYLGQLEGKAFEKVTAEISYMDATNAKHSLCEPIKGDFPAEGTKEVATDTRVLAQLGVEKKIGAKVPISFVVEDGETETIITEEFVLSGWWEYDKATMASMVNISESCCQQLVKQYHLEKACQSSWSLNVNFSDSSQIEKKMTEFVERHGYCTEGGKEGKFIHTGINWGYQSTNMENHYQDPMTLLFMAVVLVVIVLSGYLLIYNIFRISVEKDIKQYGLLKTIGTTKTQIARIIYQQGMWLSAIGIPLGIGAGAILGNGLVPFIMKMLGYAHPVVCYEPEMVLVSAGFAWLVVMFSCRKPGKIAGKVSPIEALSYTEQSGRKKKKKGTNGGKIWRMAFSNLGRSKGKTVLVTLSMALSILLFWLTYTFVSGLDMDKFMGNLYTADCLLAPENYFQYEYHEENGIAPDVIDYVLANANVKEYGCVYAKQINVQAQLTKEQIMEWENYWSQGEEDWESYEEMREERLELEMRLSGTDRCKTNVDCIGMDSLPLSYVNVLEGDLTLLENTKEKYVAVIVDTGDNGELVEQTDNFQIGEEIPISFQQGEEICKIDLRTGKEAEEDTPLEYVRYESKHVKENTYKIAAKVTLPRSISSRSVSCIQFLMGSQELCSMTEGLRPMLCLFNEAQEDGTLESVCNYYTEQVDSFYGYESKEAGMQEFEGLRKVFGVVGGLLASVVGLIGVLNFFQAIFTGICARSREFAMLQAVGMTGKQLKKMLVLEGVFYVMFASIGALGAVALLGGVTNRIIEHIIWFFCGNWSILSIVCMIPVLLLIGVCIPSILYKRVEKQSVIERIGDM